MKYIKLWEQMNQTTSELLLLREIGLLDLKIKHMFVWHGHTESNVTRESEERAASIASTNDGDIIVVMEESLGSETTECRYELSSDIVIRTSNVKTESDFFYFIVTNGRTGSTIIQTNINSNKILGLVKELGSYSAEILRVYDELEFDKNLGQR